MDKTAWLRLNWHTYAPCRCVMPHNCACPARECGREGWSKDEAWERKGKNQNRIEADIYGVTLQSEDLQEDIDALFEDGDIAHYQHGTLVAVAFEDGEVVGALTESGDGEWSAVVDEGYRGHGIATRMVKAVIREGGFGFMVAGTEDGASWLYSLYFKLTPEEREALEVSSWADIEAEMAAMA